MAIVRIATHFNIDLEFVAADFGRRMVAWMLDVLIQIFYLILAAKLLNWSFTGDDYSEDAAYNNWAIGLMVMLPVFTYHVLNEILMGGQSVGKKIMGLRVVSTSGGKPSVAQCIIRWLIRTSDYMILIIVIYLPMMASSGLSLVAAIGATFLLFMLDLIMVNVNKKGQRLGDILAHTIVINSKQQGKIEDTLFLDVDEHYVPQFPQVMQLSDRDINSIKGILQRAQKQHNYVAAENAAEKIKAHLHIESNISAFDFLDTLLKDYNYLAAR